MKIAGFQKQSLIDYPGNISSVVFTQGCNFRCIYCHNSKLVLPEKFENPIDTNYIFEYLTRYRKLLNAVCITGGEPTIHKNLPIFIKQIKELNLKVKLDTNGTNPEMLKALIDNSLIDFVAMDIKNTLNYDKYLETTGKVLSNSMYLNILKSIELIKSSKINHVFRTTVLQEYHIVEDILALKKIFEPNYLIQNLNPNQILFNTIELNPFSEKEIFEMLG